jgi:hypothetical protein
MNRTNTAMLLRQLVTRLFISSLYIFSSLLFCLSEREYSTLCPRSENRQTFHNTVGFLRDSGQACGKNVSGPTYSSLPGGEVGA